MAELIGLTGRSGSGKTKACKQIVQKAMGSGFSVFGFYCPTVFTDGVKTDILVNLLPDETTYLLGSLENRGDWLQIGRWWMDPSVFNLVNAHLNSFVYSHVLLIDEIGPYEIESNRGWPRAMEMLKESSFEIGVVSFRPAYLNFFMNEYPAMEVVDLEQDGLVQLHTLIAELRKPDILF